MYLLSSFVEFNFHNKYDSFIIYLYNVLKLLATEYHLGLLKAKLAKYRAQLLEPSKKQEKGEGFDVLKSGDARVALIGFPSVGKVSIYHYFPLNTHFICCMYTLGFGILSSYF